MSFKRDLLQGLADTLVAAGAGTFRATTAYAAGETAIRFGDMGTDPDRVICLTAYGLSGDDPQAALSTVNVQARVRGLPGNYLDVVDLDTDVYNAIHGLRERLFGATWLLQCLSKSSVPMGQDASKRWEISHNYALDANPPVTALRPH